jgi:hypothetical protein
LIQWLLLLLVVEESKDRYWREDLVCLTHGSWQIRVMPKVKVPYPVIESQLVKVCIRDVGEIAGPP